MQSKPKPVEKSFKPVNIAIDDWNEYSELATQLSKKFGVPVYIPGVIRKAVSMYKENLDKVV